MQTLFRMSMLHRMRTIADATLTESSAPLSGGGTENNQDSSTLVLRSSRLKMFLSLGSSALAENDIGCGSRRSVPIHFPATLSRYTSIDILCCPVLRPGALFFFRGPDRARIGNPAAQSSVHDHANPQNHPGIPGGFRDRFRRRNQVLPSSQIRGQPKARILLAPKSLTASSSNGCHSTIHLELLFFRDSIC